MACPYRFTKFGHGYHTCNTCYYYYSKLTEEPCESCFNSGFSTDTTRLKCNWKKNATKTKLGNEM